nr:hypothetical protein [Pandoravirus massiliensis]
MLPPLDRLANGSAFNCEEIAAEAAALDDHRAIDRCIAIASRIERLARAFQFINRADYDEWSVIHYVASWLSHIGKVPVPAYKKLHPGDTVSDSDAWVPCLGLARAAGRACSRVLFDRARSISLQALRCEWIIALDGVAKVDHYYGRKFPLADRAQNAAHVMQAFVSGLLQAPETMDRDRAMRVARRVAAALVDPIVCFGVTRPKRGMESVLHTVKVTYKAAYSAINALKNTPACDAAAYLVGALVAGIERLGARSLTSSFYKSITYESMVAYNSVFALLARASGSTLDALIQGLHVRDCIESPPQSPCDGEHRTGGAHFGPDTHLPPVDSHIDTPSRSADILLSLWTHEPDLYIDILSHLDPWDVGSLALASHAHYAHVVASVRLDDARQCHRLHPHLLLSGDRSMAFSDGALESPPERIAPLPADGGPLPDLAIILFLCRTMPTVQGNLPYDRSLVPAAAARACLLGCGDALNRCVRSISYREPMQEPHTAWSYDCVAGVADKRKHLALQLGRAAGRYGSAMLMRIAWHQSLLHGFTADQDEDDDDDDDGYDDGDGLDAGKIFLDSRLLSDVIDGILEGLGSRVSRRRGLCIEGLPKVAAVICDTLLPTIRLRMAPNHVSDEMTGKLRDTCEVGALRLLAPGKILPAASARIALAAALTRAAYVDDVH